MSTDGSYLDFMNKKNLKELSSSIDSTPDPKRSMIFFMISKM